MICYNFTRPLQYVLKKVIRILKSVPKKQQKSSLRKVNKKIAQKGMRNCEVQMQKIDR